MKKLFYRLSRSRSFVRLILILAFVALQSPLAQQAVAQTGCDDPNAPAPYCSGIGFGDPWDGTWNSTIHCTALADGINVVDFKKLRQIAPVQCTISTVATSAMCILDITYSRDAGLTTSGVTQCLNNGNNTSTLTDVAFCGNASKGLIVSGTLNCNPQNVQPPNLPPICGGNTLCTANLDGITGVPNGKCSVVFPADITKGLAEGQVLSASVLTEGTDCSGQVKGHSNIVTRFCDSGSFDNNAPSACIVNSGTFAAITGNTTPVLPVDVDL